MPGDPFIVEIKVGRRPLPDDVRRDLAFVRVEQSVTLPDRFDIQIYDPQFQHLDNGIFKIGADVEIAFRAAGRLTTVTTGFITSVSSEAGRDTSDRLVIVGFDASFKLTLEPHSETFLNLKGSEIASKIAGNHGLSADTDSSPFKYEYCLQRNETDYEFLQRIAAENGFRFWVTEKKLYFKMVPESSRTEKLRMGDDLLKLNLRMSAAGRADSSKAAFWDEKQAKVMSAEAKSPGKATYASANLMKQVNNEASRAFGKTKLTTGQAPVRELAQAEATAAANLRNAEAGQVILKGEAVGSPLIAAGSKVEISGAGDTASGTYLLTSAEHVYGTNITYVTRFTSGEREPAGLVDLLGGARQQQGNAYSPWGQIMSAVVTSIKDPESTGRVKVKFPTLEKEEESDWARVLGPEAGKDAGLRLMPEVNDEVLIGFEYGDPRRPIILGGLWNGKNKPPEDAKRNTDDGKVQKRTWKSRKGHSIELWDDKEPKIVIADGVTKATLSMTKDGIGLKTTDAKHKVTVDSAGEVEVQSKKDISVKGNKITVEGKGALTLKGSKIDINSKGNVTIKGATIQLN